MTPEEQSAVARALRVALPDAYLKALDDDSNNCLWHEPDTLIEQNEWLREGESWRPKWPSQYLAIGDSDGDYYFLDLEDPTSPLYIAPRGQLHLIDCIGSLAAFITPGESSEPEPHLTTRPHSWGAEHLEQIRLELRGRRREFWFSLGLLAVTLLLIPILLLQASKLTCYASVACAIGVVLGGLGLLNSWAAISDARERIAHLSRHANSSSDPPRAG